MTYYSNEASIKDAVGEAEASALMQDSPGTGSESRLEKAAKRAYDTINNILRSGGYVVPVEFTEYAATLGEGVTPIPLDGQLQAASDALTVFYMAVSYDLAKEQHTLAHKNAMEFLMDVLNNKIRLDIERPTTPAGNGQFVTLARARVLTTSAKTEAELLGRETE